MVKVTVTQGMALEVVLSRILRENGLHVIQVHNGVVTRHGKLERVRDEEWVRDEMEGSRGPETPDEET